MTSYLLALVLATASDPVPGAWRAWLDSPGGELPFELSIESRATGSIVTIQNGEETIDAPLARDADGSVQIEFPHYDSALTARLAEGGAALEGEWRQARAGGAVRRMPFHARAGAAPRFPGSADAASTIAGRWAVKFEKDANAAVALFRAEGTRVLGTILTATGDHRFLAGVLQADRLRLSCFDGAHAFLYDARVQADGTLRGTFSSGDTWQEGFTARRDEAAKLQDEFAQAHWAEDPGLLWIEGIALDGRETSVGELLFGARASVIQIAGSWCPNCHDELRWLAPLAQELASQGLRAVTLGFELAGERERDLRQLGRMRTRHGAGHPFLLVGTADKERAAAAIGAIDRVVAFPTLAILGADGLALAVHSGFAGPATGEEHARLVRTLEAHVRAALAAPETPSPALEALLAEGLWRDERDRTFLELRRETDGRVAFVEREMFRFDGPTREEPVAQGAVVAHGDVVRIGERLWQYDRRAQVALDPRDLGHRLTPAARGPFPRVSGSAGSGPALDAPEAILAGLAHSDPRLRRECTWFLAAQILTAMFAPPDHAPQVDAANAAQIVPRLQDTDPLVRATACWAAGVLRIEAALEALRTNAAHPFPAVRREAAKALAVLERR